MSGQHGHAARRTRAYSSWMCMRRRCSDPSFANYARYGGLGISVCPEWDRFEVFFGDMGNPPPGMTLDRRNARLGYYKGNCRWATAVEQAQNRRDTVYLTHQGETQCLVEWERRLGFPKDRIGQRLRSGWSVERALTTPLRPRRV